MGPVFRQVHRAIEQTLEARHRIAEMHADHTVVHFSFVAVPLSSGSHRVGAALGHPRFIHGADGLGVRVVADHHLLATIAQFFFIPLDRFQKAL